MADVLFIIAVIDNFDPKDYFLACKYSKKIGRHMLMTRIGSNKLGNQKTPGECPDTLDAGSDVRTLAQILQE